MLENLAIYLWIGIAVLIAGSIYFIVEGVKVHKILQNP